MTNQEPDNEKGSRAFMAGLTASDDMHRQALRGLPAEVSIKLLKDYYHLTDDQAAEAYRLRDVVGMSEDDAVKKVLGK